MFMYNRMCKILLSIKSFNNILLHDFIEMALIV